MKYEEFVAAVCKDIRGFLPERYTKTIIEPIHVDKVQKASYYGIFVREENTGKGLSMDLAYWFSQVCEQEVNLHSPRYGANSLNPSGSSSLRNSS